MDPVILAALAAAGALLAALAALVVVLRQAAVLHQLKLLGEQTRLGLDAAAATQRAALAETERAVVASGAVLRGEVTGTIEALRGASEQRLGDLQRVLAEALRAVTEQSAAAAGALRTEVAEQLRVAAEQAGTAAGALRTELGGMRAETNQALLVLREGNERKLAEIQGAVTVQLAAAAEQAGAAALALRAEIGGMRAETHQALLALREGNEKKLAEIQGAVTVQLAAAAEQAGAAALALRAEIGGMRAETHQALLALREGNEKKLAEIQGAVNEQLAKSVEQQMTASFARVTEQFAQVQKAMGEMQAVGAQIGDLKRLFGNVKARGGWGETQVRALLDDVLPPGAWETNWKPRADGEDVVEFAVIMPMRGANRPRLAVDAKFPVEAYERLLTAQDAGNGDDERAARRDLATSVRGEARKIAAKYIVPPATVEFAVMYLPTDGLYAEVARIDGLIDELGRLHRVLVMGPSLFPALLRTIHLGHVTLALEQKADEVRLLLGAARGEMQKMDAVLTALGKQATTFSNTIERARVRTRAIDRQLRAVDVIDPEAAALLLGAEEAVDVPAEAAEDGAQ